MNIPSISIVVNDYILQAGKISQDNFRIALKEKLLQADIKINIDEGSEDDWLIFEMKNQPDLLIRPENVPIIIASDSKPLAEGFIGDESVSKLENKARAIVIDVAGSLWNGPVIK